MPARIRGVGYESPRRHALMSQAEWERHILQATERMAREGRQTLDTLHLNGCRSETKLSVREQARQFEERGLQRNSLSSLSPIVIKDWDGTDTLELSSETLLSIMDYPNSPVSLGRDIPPSWIIAQEDDSWPVYSLKPTPPILRKFSTSLSNFMTVQPCQITVEIIPDPPEEPAPPPPTFTKRPATPPTSPPSSPPPSPPTPSYLTPQASPSPIPKHPPPPPPPPLPPPLPPPSFPISDISRPTVQFVPTSLPPASTLRPVSERKRPPPPVPYHSGSELGKTKELKGILKNLQNLADIERSVANLYSQVDKTSKVPKLNKKPQVTDDSQSTNEVLNSDPRHEQGMPNVTAANSTSESTAENTTSQMDPETEETNQMNLDNPSSADMSEQSSTHSTVF